MPLKLIAIVVITLLFFSTSSVLARAALVDNSIDPFAFTLFRLLFGAIVLLAVLYIKERKIDFKLKRNWGASFMLFLYAICFSFAFLNLDAGLGALILFAVVQLTVIVSGLINKEKLTSKKVLGIVISFIGLVYLLYPTEESLKVTFLHTFLTIISGIAWGLYTIYGKSSSNATLNTTENFTKSLVFVFLFLLFYSGEYHATSYGITLAFISGGVTSAFGYLMWYYLLPNLKIITAGVLQLLIPPIAVALGVVFLDEELTIKLIVSSVVILGGIFIYLKAKVAKD